MKKTIALLLTFVLAAGFTPVAFAAPSAATDLIAGFRAGTALTVTQPVPNPLYKDSVVTFSVPRDNFVWTDADGQPLDNGAASTLAPFNQTNFAKAISTMEVAPDSNLATYFGAGVFSVSEDKTLLLLSFTARNTVADKTTFTVRLQSKNVQTPIANAAATFQTKIVDNKDETVTGLNPGGSALVRTDSNSAMTVGQAIHFAVPGDNLVWSTSGNGKKSALDASAFDKSLIHAPSNFTGDFLVQGDTLYVRLTAATAGNVTGATVRLSVVNSTYTFPVLTITDTQTASSTPAPPSAPAVQTPAPETPATITSVNSAGPAPVRTGPNAGASTLQIGEYILYALSDTNFNWSEGNGQKDYSALTAHSDYIIAPQGFTGKFVSYDNQPCIQLTATTATSLSGTPVRLAGQAASASLTIIVAPNMPSTITGVDAAGPVLVRTGDNAAATSILVNETILYAVKDENFLWSAGNGSKDYAALTAQGGANLIDAPTSFTGRFVNYKGQLCVELTANMATTLSGAQVRLKGQTAAAALNITVTATASKAANEATTERLITGFKVSGGSAPVPVGGEFGGKTIKVGDVLRLVVNNDNFLWSGSEGDAQKVEAGKLVSTWIIAPEGFTAAFEVTNNQAVIVLTATTPRTYASGTQFKLSGHTPYALMAPLAVVPVAPPTIQGVSSNSPALKRTDSATGTIKIRDSITLSISKDNFIWMSSAGSGAAIFTQAELNKYLGWVKGVHDAYYTTSFVVDASGNAVLKLTAKAATPAGYSTMNIFLSDGTNSTQPVSITAVVLSPSPTKPVIVGIKPNGPNLVRSDTHGNVVNKGTQIKYKLSTDNFIWDNGQTYVAASSTPGLTLLGLIAAPRLSVTPLATVTTGVAFSQAELDKYIGWVVDVPGFTKSFLVDSSGTAWLVLTAINNNTPVPTTTITISDGVNTINVPITSKPFVSVTGNKITGIADGAYLGEMAELNGKLLAAGALDDLEAEAGDELLLYLDSDYFQWQNGNPSPTVPVTESMLRTGKITVRSSVKTSGILKSTEFITKSGRAYVRIRFVDTFVSTKDKDFSMTLYLSYNSTRNRDSEVTITGTMANKVIDVYGDDEYVDLSDGVVALANDYVKKITVDLGQDVLIRTRMYKNKKYYGTASQEPDDDDIKIMNKYRDIETVYTLSTVGLNSTGNIVEFDIPERMYVYDSVMNYLGTTKEKLPYSVKYYLAAKKLNVTQDYGEVEEVDETGGGGGGSGTTGNEPSGIGLPEAQSPAGNANANPLNGR